MEKIKQENVNSSINLVIETHSFPSIVEKQSHLPLVIRAKQKSLTISNVVADMQIFDEVPRTSSLMKTVNPIVKPKAAKKVSTAAPSPRASKKLESMPPLPKKAEKPKELAPLQSSPKVRNEQ